MTFDTVAGLALVVGSTLYLIFAWPLNMSREDDNDPKD